MSYEDRINSAIAVIEEHNSSLEKSTKRPVSGVVIVDDFIAALKAMGGTTEERLKRLMWEDIVQCLPITNGVKPIPLARDIAKALRGADSEIKINAWTGKGEESEVVVSTKKANRLTPAQLLAAFDPDDADNAVGKRLKELSKGEPFLVFSSGKTVDQITSLKLLNEIRGGYSGRPDTTVDGEIKPTYRVGESVENVADENPIYEGRPLRPDGTCDQTGRSWEGVPQNVRQLVRLAIQTGELPAIIDNAHNVLDIAISMDAFKKLATRYRKAALRFVELEKTGGLPTLKIALRRGKNSPFGNAKKVIHE